MFRSLDYWMLLLVCLAVPFLGFALSFLQILGARVNRRSVIKKPPNDRIRLLARLFFIFGIAWLLVRIVIGIQNPVKTIYGAWFESLEVHYRVRYMVMDLFSDEEMGLAYSGLLILFAFPLYYAIYAERSWRSWVEVLIWFALYSVLALCLVQKLLISLAIMVIGLAIFIAGDLMKRWLSLLCVGGALLLLISAAMSNLTSSWSLTATFEQIIFRVADGYPYAVAMGPAHPFSLSQYWVGSLVGKPGTLGVPGDYNVRIFEMMFPLEKGAAAISAPVWAYCDVGWYGAAITLFLIAVMCYFIGVVGKFVEQSVWAWAIYILLMIQLYHLTQIPFLGVFMWSYGAGYSVIVLIILAFCANWIERKMEFDNVDQSTGRR